MPSYYPIYIALYSLFIVINLYKDFFNHAFNLITLINNPMAMLSVVPVFIFSVGANSNHLKNIFKLLMIIGVIFLFVWIIKLPGRIPYYEGILASNAIIPLFIISIIKKENRLFAFALIFLAIPFSMVSDQRIILLKILVFFSLSVSLNMAKNSSVLKFIIMVVGCLIIYLMLNNLESVLNFFKAEIGSKGFDANDTRSFLYNELFNDFKKSELFFGRGFLGTYFSPYFLMLIKQSLDSSGDSYQRFSSEVGFLQLLLKGGFVFYFLYTLPLWYVSVRGIFGSSASKISFYIAIYIFTELLLMFIGNTPYFGFQFSLLFFLAGYAYRVMYLYKKVNQNFVYLRAPTSLSLDFI